MFININGLEENVQRNETILGGGQNDAKINSGSQMMITTGEIDSTFSITYRSVGPRRKARMLVYAQIISGKA